MINKRQSTPQSQDSTENLYSENRWPYFRKGIVASLSWSLEDVTAAKMCNCQKAQKSCPMDAQCLTSAVVYNATVTASDGDVRTYTESTDRKFKDRLYEHRSDANNRSHMQ